MNTRRRWLRPPVAAVLLAIGTALGAWLTPAVAGPPRVATQSTLGRLFLTPEQRRILDAQRSRVDSPNDSSLPRDLLPAGTATRRRVVLSGVVRRRAGGPVVWINGRQIDAAALARDHMRVARGPDAENRVTVEAGDEGASARLKPGQVWDPDNGDISDCVQCGMPPVPPVPPAPEPTAALERRPP